MLLRHEDIRQKVVLYSHQLRHYQILGLILESELFIQKLKQLACEIIEVSLLPKSTNQNISLGEGWNGGCSPPNLDINQLHQGNFP